VLAYVDAGGAPPDAPVLTPIAAGRLSELLIAAEPSTVDDYRATLGRAGFRAVAHVDLVDDGGQAQPLYFAGPGDKSLDRFKDALWAVDEFAGVRYRDPRDSGHALVDISLQPHLGPLRRALLRRLAEAGECTVADLREHTRTQTIYRAVDAGRAVSALLSSGALKRRPERGRLTGDILVRPA
jgi:hypothetical protein